jgi:hypothetical protein
VDSPHIAKLISLYAKGVVTAPEMANSLLIDLIRDDSCDTELPSFLGELPDAVRQKLQDLLREIQEAEYRWKPFMIGPGGSVLHSDADDSARLRRLCTVLEISQGTAANGSKLGKSDGM